MLWRVIIPVYKSVASVLTDETKNPAAEVTLVALAELLCIPMPAAVYPVVVTEPAPTCNSIRLVVVVFTPLNITVIRFAHDGTPVMSINVLPVPTDCAVAKVKTLEFIELTDAPVITGLVIDGLVIDGLVNVLFVSVCVSVVVTSVLVPEGNVTV
jgi:hypothetical protein